MSYEGIEDHKYLNLAGKGIGLAGTVDILRDIAGDCLLVHLDLSYNISADEFAIPSAVEGFIRAMKINLTLNKTLTALDLAGNHLFENKPHPVNEHTKNYVVLLTNMLLQTKITHLDVSDNTIAGVSCRELKGLAYLATKFIIGSKAFICKFSLLNTAALKVICCGMGINSSLTYLDLSDNLLGIDPLGKPNSEGIEALAGSLKHTLQLRVLKLARNFLKDDDMVLIANAIEHMPLFHDLDIGGNKCEIHGAKAFKTAIISHSVLAEEGIGFRELDLSNTPLRFPEVEQLAIAISRTETLKTLKLRFCEMNEKSIKRLQKALDDNSSVTSIDVSHNFVSADAEQKTTARAEAMRLVFQLREDINSVDPSTLSPYVYSALAHKLRVLSREQLQALHEIPSYNVHHSEMRNALHMLEPPPRGKLIKEVLQKDGKMLARLAASAETERRVWAAQRIFDYVSDWYEDIRMRNKLHKAILEAQRKEEEFNAKNDKDAIYNY